MINWGPFLRKERIKAGLTQEQMALELNISRPNISKMERGQINLSASDLFRWLQVTNAHEVVAVAMAGTDPVVLTNFINLASQFIAGLILHI